MPVRLHHIVIGTDDSAPVGMRFMLVSDPKTPRTSWTILADPGGNEFCVVRPEETLTR